MTELRIPEISIFCAKGEEEGTEFGVCACVDLQLLGVAIEQGDKFVHLTLPISEGTKLKEWLQEQGF